MTTFTTYSIASQTYYITHTALTLTNLNWSIDKTPLCNPITYVLQNSDTTTADTALFTVGASTVTVYTTDTTKHGNTYNLVLIAKVGTYASASRSFTVTISLDCTIVPITVPTIAT